MDWSMEHSEGSTVDLNLHRTALFVDAGRRMPPEKFGHWKRFICVTYANTSQPCLTQSLLVWNHNNIILPRFMLGLSPHASSILTFKFFEHDCQHQIFDSGLFFVATMYVDGWLHCVAPIQLWKTCRLLVTYQPMIIAGGYEKFRLWRTKSNKSSKCAINLGRQFLECS